MAMAFLNKKSWHTATLKNVETVWVAQQKKKEEDKKLKELQRQLQEVCCNVQVVLKIHLTIIM